MAAPMAAPVGLDHERVVDAAVAVVEERGGIESLALRDVAARLGVRPQSLYAHVEGLGGLRRDLAVRGLGALARRLGVAAIGLAGANAVEAIIREWVGFALEHPGLYAASLRPPAGDEEVADGVAAATLPLTIVFRSYGLDDETATHWLRTIFAAVHGFVSLRRDGLLTLPGDPDETVTHLIRVFARQLEDDAAAASAPSVTEVRRR